MKKSSILFFIIILSFNIPLVYSATDEGYGEDQTNLGQFVDSFENTNNISVMNNLIRNSTLNLIEVNVSAPINWLEGYSHRKKITIGSLADANINYQIKIIAHYGSGSDSGNEVYLNSLIQIDFDDVNFTQDDEVTTIDYWKSQVFLSDNTTFWVEVPHNISIPNQEIYMYYGNSTTETFSNGVNTFIEFWDMEGTEGNEPTEWNDDSSASCEFKLSETYNHTGNSSVRMKDANSNGWSIGRIESDVTESIIAIHYFAYFPQVGVNSFGIWRVGIDTDLVFDITFRSDNHVYARNGAGFTTIMNNYVFNRWYEIELIIDYDSDTYDCFIDGILEGNNLNFYASRTSGKYIRIISGKSYSVGTYWYNDDVFIRKYVDGDQPSLTFGEEEQLYGNAYMITTNYMNYLNGSSLVFLLNSSIGIGDMITIQFSNDNSTWVDNEGNTDSNTVVAGFYSLDIRDLNYTNIYSMLNFTGDAKLYQLRLVSTIGLVVNGGVVVGGINSSVILIVIFLFIIGSALFIGVARRK